jgi:hypothetical protein
MRIGGQNLSLLKNGPNSLEQMFKRREEDVKMRMGKCEGENAKGQVLQ